MGDYHCMKTRRPSSPAFVSPTQDRWGGRYLRASLNLCRSPRGVALVTVLAVLTLLALLAVVFQVQTSVIVANSQDQTRLLQAQLLAQSGLEHACSMLRDDLEQQPAFDDESEAWAQAFAPDPARPEDAADIDGLALPNAADARWIYVRNAPGRLVGRYAVLIEDETGKINVNTARALNPQMQNEGVGTFEVMLSDGKLAGLPLSLPFVKDILRFRYGRDLAPGQALRDDNNNALRFALDLTDNDADGVVDEVDEGIDEPDEYNPLQPVWDDRVISSLREVSSGSIGHAPLSASAANILRKYATVHSRTRPVYWEARDRAWRAQLNINATSRRQLQSMLTRANSEQMIEPDDIKLRVIAANILDYRDENHVLSTVGSEYGIESVCFSEILANDGSFVVRADRNNPASSSSELVHRVGWWYELAHLQKLTRSFRYGWKLDRVSGGGARATVRLEKNVILSTTREGQAFEKFTDLTGNLKWIPDMWKNAYLMVYAMPTNTYDNYYVPYLITGNGADELEVRCSGKENDTYAFLASQVSGVTGVYNAVMINNFWRNNPGGLVTVVPEVSETLYCPVNLYAGFTPPKGLYYNVFIGENNLPETIVKGSQLEDANVDTHYMQVWEPLLRPSVTPYKGFYPSLDTDGDPSSYSETRMLELTADDLRDTSLTLPGGAERAWLLRTPYAGGVAQRAQDGYVRVTVSTCRDAGADDPRSVEAYRNKNVVQHVYLLRPDILELYNISDHAVSLANWRIVINTGSYADQVARIRTATHYSTLRGTRYDDPNPVIQPKGYFYITNHRNIFDLEYGGSRDGIWGNSQMEAFPCAEMPDFLWGVRYEVTDTKNGKISCKGADFRTDQLKYEMCEWHLRKPRADQNSPFGIITTIIGNTRDILDMGNVSILSLHKGDDITIRGMPREGGFVSMTLRNEYDQIAARTVEYANTALNESFASSVKLDPARYTWVKSRVATFGGTARDARNQSSARDAALPRIKNAPFVSVGDVLKVRAADNWRTLGTLEGGTPTPVALRSLARFFTVSGTRLDAEEENAHISGWRPAFASVKAGAVNGVTAADALWQPNIWNAQTLRMLTGPLCGEAFAVSSNSSTTITIDGYSAPGNKQLHALPGERFSLGPGYASAMFYSRNNGDEGIWEWQQKGLAPATYALYLFGLNDAISTTEFLEENYNAHLSVAAFNFATRVYDPLPLPSRDTRGLFADYLRGPLSTDLQCDKTDGIFCGLLGPDHISPSGGIRLRIVPSGLNHPRSSGFAWFDFALVTPCPEWGRINVNTASERALNALIGVTPELAQAIRTNTRNGKPNAMPCYESPTDILEVRGVTPQLYAKNANLITTRSDQFRVRVIAQALRDANGDGAFDPGAGDAITARVTRDVIVDRSPVIESGPQAPLRVILGD